ncbi:hypothetical protein THRCLA_04857 [Thraustotheca clavata]|uniref:Uncharacterized protein n=1 Tax=Thraustotheca clavata TaxID=74557 RepID=A0A1V9ZXR4_9STRA|nr:hypothetical protein THRCLA_04857 [Thraustotheca clavata]
MQPGKRNDNVSTLSKHRKDFVPKFDRANLWKWQDDSTDKQPKRPQTARRTRTPATPQTKRPQTARRHRESTPCSAKNSDIVMEQLTRTQADTRIVFMRAHEVSLATSSSNHIAINETRNTIEPIAKEITIVESPRKVENIPPKKINQDPPQLDQDDSEKQWSFYEICRAGEASSKALANPSQREYYRRCSQVLTVPKPIHLDNCLDLTNKCYGYANASALAKRFHEDTSVSKLILSNNGLKSNAISELMPAINSTAISVVDLSKNNIGPVGIHSITSVLTTTTSNLVKLVLSHNYLMDRHVLPLVTILDKTSLQSLDLSYNQLDNGSIVPLGHTLQYCKSLKKLNLRWNNIHGAGLDSLADALKKNQVLSTLDLSWNPINSSNEPSRLHALNNFSTMLRRNVGLYHLILESNQFSVEDLKIIDAGLKHNYTVIVHLQSDVGVMDANQHIKFEHFAKDMISDQVVDTATNQNNCWKCNQWYEHTFTYEPKNDTKLDQINLYLSIDEFQAEAMSKSKVDQSFHRHRMLPQEEIKFFMGLSPPSTLTSLQILPPPEQDKKFSCRRAYPRWNPTKHDPSALESSWSAHRSLFNERQTDFPSIAMFDTDIVLHQAWEHDWEESRLPRIVRRQKEQIQLFDLIKLHYRELVYIYKFYASLTLPRSCTESDGFGLRATTFARLCEDCDVYDDTFCNPVAVDRLFNEVNSHEAAASFISAKAVQKSKLLSRSEFIEVIVRLGRYKYGRLPYRAGNSSRSGMDIGQAFLSLLQHNILPRAQRIVGDAFRRDLLYIKSTDDILENYRQPLQLIHETYGSLQTIRRDLKLFKSKHFMDLAQTFTFLKEVGFLLTKDNVRQIQQCFLSSKLIIHDKFATLSASWLSFYDFLEFIVRLSHWKYSTDAFGLSKMLHTVFQSLCDTNPTLQPRLRNVVKDFELTPTIASKAESKAQQLNRVWASRR